MNSESCKAKPVLLNDFKRQWIETGAQVQAAMQAVGESGWYILGPEVEAFEKKLSALWNRRFAVGVASGLDALEIGLRCAGCKAGDKVLMPPVSAFATALAAIRIGAIPVFVDCDARGLVDLDLAERAFREDAAIRYFIPVHLYGHSLDMARLRDFRDRLGIQIIEDCAQSILASHRGVLAGTAGVCAATSFYPTKNLGALGDGGALLTDSEEIAAQARRLRDYGQVSKYSHGSTGYNSRLDELQAAILGRVFLPLLNSWTSRRRSVAARYLTEIRNPWLVAPGAPEASESSWHLFPVLVSEGSKAEFMNHLAALGVRSGEHYPRVMMDQPVMSEVPHREAGACGVARQFCRREVSLPIHPYLGDDEISRVIEACNQWRAEAFSRL